MSWFLNPAQPFPLEYLEKAKAYQATLTKPQGALGALEDIAIRFSAYQKTLSPKIDQIQVVVMAADHGVAVEDVSLFPQSVTAEMIENFAHGGAAISVVARNLSAKLTVFNLGTVNKLKSLANIIDAYVGPGTENFTRSSAMTMAQCEKALNHGKEAADWAKFSRCQLFIGGEMGIGNSTSAAAIASAILLRPAADIAGPGTGLDSQGVEHKINVIERGLALHQDRTPLQVLKNLGGFEIAALVGAYISCAQQGIPVLLDGFISTAAALIASAINPSIKPWMMASHNSQEPGHQLILNSLGLTPLVDLRLRLGEASGAAVVVPLLQSACLLQGQMATFEAAQVSQ